MNPFIERYDEYLDERYYYAKHPSGLDIYVFPKDFAVSYGLLTVKYGSFDNRFATKGTTAAFVPEGIAHFLEHKMFDNEDGSDTFEKFAEMGAYCNAYTTFDRTAYMFSSTERHKECLSELLSFVFSPYFTEKTVEKEKGIIAEEIKMGLDNPSPELSADIIRSHANDGYDLIKANHLPDFLADIALQHHGTMPIRYFYAKALKMTDGELNIEDFSYMGPKPQTKLAAIIMIADASEAAVRAVDARKPEQAEKAIRGIIEERMDLEQFSECDITMVELTKIRMALVASLSGVYHHRIKYPSIKYKRTEYGTKGENA